MLSTKSTSYSAIFFSYNKSVNNIFYHDLLAKRTRRYLTRAAILFRYTIFSPGRDRVVSDVCVMRLFRYMVAKVVQHVPAAITCDHAST